MRENSLAIPLLSSLIIHGLIIVVAPTVVHNHNFGRQEFIPISLVEVPPLQQKTEMAAEAKNPSSAKTEKPNEIRPVVKNHLAKLERPAPPVVKEEAANPIEAKPSMPAKAEAPAILSVARLEGGGSEASSGNLFGKGDGGLLPGSGNGGGGGTAASGLGRGAGAPGLPAQTALLRTNREAKPVQTVRAAYPTMALRAGLESDVILRIEVDPQGTVTKAEIIKSGGGGFDEEALKAVKQSRFEPAQRDGQNVPAEFTFVYRFRLQR